MTPRAFWDAAGALWEQDQQNPNYLHVIWDDTCLMDDVLETTEGVPWLFLQCAREFGPLVGAA